MNAYVLPYDHFISSFAQTPLESIGVNIIAGGSFQKDLLAILVMGFVGEHGHVPLLMDL